MTTDLDPSDLNKGAKGLHIGVMRNFHETDSRADLMVLKAIEDAIAVFRGECAGIRDVTLPPALEDYRAVGFVVLLTEAYAIHEK